ncbi:NADH dehydrogenase [ubiquinone] iron-sulfur protein 6, mitochondrial [Halotydeus destructor]|nr:NADH dehydrogenase [ubiquinone] iron-sulfur protein 6, mitochondrial [Halotydeus destructor]
MAARLTLVCSRALGRPQVTGVAIRTIGTSSPALAEAGDNLPVEKGSWDLKDTKTHTGQKFDEDDFRLTRFVGKIKEVNTRFAIDLIAEVPPKAVKARKIHCDGGDGPLGHPRVFINLDQPGDHACGYCGLRFFQDKSGHDHH